MGSSSYRTIARPRRRFHVLLAVTVVLGIVVVGALYAGTFWIEQLVERSADSSVSGPATQADAGHVDDVRALMDDVVQLDADLSNPDLDAATRVAVEAERGAVLTVTCDLAYRLNDPPGDVVTFIANECDEDESAP